MRQQLLVIDDEQAICDTLADYLKHFGYNVATTTNCQEALALIDEVSPKLVILDIVMPDMDGLDLMERIRQDHPELLVIFLTGIGYQDDVMREAMEKGANGYLSKGLPLQQLLMEIHRVIRQADGKKIPA